MFLISGDINAADAWIGINGSNLNDFCGGDALAEALDGGGTWAHAAEHGDHWFILDLGETYTIKSVRGRSLSKFDPIQVDIYVSDDTGDWGTAVTDNIATWQDTFVWQEVDTEDKDGRYIKVVIERLEDAAELHWGGEDTPFTIFDAYGSVPSGPAAETILVGNQEWSTSSSWSYGSGTDLTTATTSVELDLPKPVSHFSTSTDDIYWGLGIPSTTSMGVYRGTTTFEVVAD